MTKYEYKTVKLDVTLESKGLLGFQSFDVPDLKTTLNTEGKVGWRLCDTILPIFNSTSSNKVIIVLERKLVE
ncbi:DUF4177 domain-containing protein [Candidatus Poribacteria bacterium]|nr:DUF4177 domain-containing protein [Candidatus Poribacteria bacterium]